MTEENSSALNLRAMTIHGMSFLLYMASVGLFLVFNWLSFRGISSNVLYINSVTVSNVCNFMAQVILNYILWQLGKKEAAQASPEVVDEEDPYEGMDYHEDGGQIFPNAK